jgi:low temperature requirement protein LtrA
MKSLAKNNIVLAFGVGLSSLYLVLIPLVWDGRHPIDAIMRVLPFALWLYFLAMVKISQSKHRLATQVISTLAITGYISLLIFIPAFTVWTLSGAPVRVTTGKGNYAR